MGYTIRPVAWNGLNTSLGKGTSRKTSVDFFVLLGTCLKDDINFEIFCFLVPPRSSSFSKYWLGGNFEKGVM